MMRPVHWLGFLIIMGVGFVVVMVLIVWGIPANERRLAARAQMESVVRAGMDWPPDEQSASERDAIWGGTMAPAEFPQDDASEEWEGRLEDSYDRWAAFTDEELAELENALDAVEARAAGTPTGAESLADEISAEIAQRAEDA
jgi:hypothetical protein